MRGFKTIFNCRPSGNLMMHLRVLIIFIGTVSKKYTKFHICLQLWLIIRFMHAGAWVAVNCHSPASERKGKSMVARGVTDEFGDFMVDLPSHLHAIPNLEKICTVKVHRIPKGSLCRPAHVKKYKGLRLSSFGNGIRTYSAGNIRIQHSTSEPLHAPPRMDGGEEQRKWLENQVHKHCASLGWRLIVTQLGCMDFPYTYIHT